MNIRDDQRQLLIRYLLEELPPQETAQIDERFLSDDAFLAEMEDVYFDLVDSLTSGELTGEQQERASKALRNWSEQKTRFAAARLLQRDRGAVDSRAGGVSRVPRRGLILGFLSAAAVIAIVFFLFHHQPGRTGNQGAVSNTNLASGNTATETTFAILLSPEVLRGETIREVQVPRKTEMLRFQLVLPEGQPASEYSVQIMPRGRGNPTTVSVSPHTLGDQRYLQFDLSSSSLPPGDYTISALIPGTPSKIVASYDISIIAAAE
jgi:hypothetical protein